MTYWSTDRVTEGIGVKGEDILPLTLLSLLKEFPKALPHFVLTRHGPYGAPESLWSVTSREGEKWATVHPPRPKHSFFRSAGTDEGVTVS